MKNSERDAGQQSFRMILSGDEQAMDSGIVIRWAEWEDVMIFYFEIKLHMCSSLRGILKQTFDSLPSSQGNLIPFKI